MSDIIIQTSGYTLRENINIFFKNRLKSNKITPFDSQNKQESSMKNKIPTYIVYVQI